MTFSLRVRYPPFGASAHHSPDGNGVQNAAHGSSGARRQFSARIYAFVLYASQSTRAIRVDPAFRFGRSGWRSLAICQRISFRKMFGTATSRCVVVDVADSISSAGRIGVGRARIDASLIDAGAIVRTFVVGTTFHALASRERVAIVAGRTPALASVVRTEAVGVGRARIAEYAWI